MGQTRGKLIKVVKLINTKHWPLQQLLQYNIYYELALDIDIEIIYSTQ